MMKETSGAQQTAAAPNIAAAPKKRRKPWLAGAALLLALFAVRGFFRLFGGRMKEKKHEKPEA